MKKQIIENLKKCPRFDSCSINICPLDLEINLRNKLPGEKDCPFMIKKKSRLQKGIKTLVPYGVLKFIPKSNVELLNKRSQKRWQEVSNK
jgi:hypothetical protein